MRKKFAFAALGSLVTAFILYSFSVPGTQTRYGSLQSPTERLQAVVDRHPADPVLEAAASLPIFEARTRLA